MTTNLFNLVSSVKGNTFANVDYVSEVKIPQKYGFAKGAVTSETEVSVLLNHSYQNAVNNHRKAEGGTTDFVAESLPWGAWEIPNKVITHKGVRYLRMYLHNNSNPQTTYFVNGRKATDAETAVITAWKASENAKKTARAQGTQGAVKTEKPLNVKFDNVLSLTVSGEHYKKAVKAVI